MLRLLIFGASGKTGHELVNQALAQGHLVTAFVRTPSKLRISHNSLNVIQGDATDYRAVENAVKGHDAVFSTMGAASPLKFDQTVVDGVKNIVKAMEATGIGRFV